MAMHTDEYEISINREIVHCRKVVEKIENKLAERRQRFGCEYPEASAAASEGRLAIGERELAGWREDYEALPVWRQRLAEYREALSVMRISASRFE